MRIAVYGTPGMLPEGGIGETAVVIDALRMTSVAATAMANGCGGLRAVSGVEAARAIATETGALLGGEREALRIEGFDFSNSPLEYVPERIAGRRLVMTTSNGTRAIIAAQGARRLLLGAFVNASAVADALIGARDVAIVCAGTLGAFTLEDALAAGAILHRLRQRTALMLDDMAIAVDRLYAGACGDLHAVLGQTKHYARLVSLGFDADLAYCLAEDTVEAVPQLRADGWFA